MQDWRAIFARNVRRVRKQKGMTQEELAFSAKIDLTYVGGIERSKRNPSLLVMGRIAKALSVPLPKPIEWMTAADRFCTFWTDTCLSSGRSEFGALTGHAVAPGRAARQDVPLMHPLRHGLSHQAFHRYGRRLPDLMPILIIAVALYALYLWKRGTIQ